MNDRVDLVPTLQPGAQVRSLCRQIRDVLSSTHQDAAPGLLLQRLVDESLAELPRPGFGCTLERWQALCEVAMHDLSLAKLYEGHTDARAILAELGDDQVPAGSAWGVWAAESRDARVLSVATERTTVRLRGRKSWCSGAKVLTHVLLTTWQQDGTGPILVRVALAQPGVRVTEEGWNAVGMAASGSVDVEFDDAEGSIVGAPRDYLSRPGFWHGGAGIAACWYGGCASLARTLQSAVAASARSAADPFRAVALGRVDVALRHTAAVLREAAAWIDRYPLDDAGAMALRVRLSAEQCVDTVLSEVGKALGAPAFCRNARFARIAADLPVFVRQSHAARDCLALAERVVDQGVEAWQL